MEDSRKMGLILGSSGAILGGISWIVILGITLKSIVITILPLVLGILCFFAVVILANKYLERYLSILGAVIAAISIINLIFVNLLFERIPDKIGAVSTGKESFSLVCVNIFVGVALVIGLSLILVNFFRKKNNGN